MPVKTGKILQESTGLKRQVTLKNGASIEKLVFLQTKMSIREGRSISLEEVVNRIVEFAYERMKGEFATNEKNPTAID